MYQLAKFDVAKIYHKDIGRFPPSGFSVLLSQVRDTFPVGKVALVLKKGKKKLLVKGWVTAVPDSSPQFGLTWEWYFSPKNDKQREKLQSCLVNPVNPVI